MTFPPQFLGSPKLLAFSPGLSHPQTMGTFDWRDYLAFGLPFFAQILFPEPFLRSPRVVVFIPGFVVPV